MVARLMPAFATPPFDIRFGRMGTHCSLRAGRPRVVWLGIEIGTNRVADLRAEVVRRLADVAFPREARPFSPHLTLARFKRGGGRANAGRRARLESSRQADVPSTT